MGSGASKSLKEAILQGNVEDITKNIRTLFVDDEFPPERHSIGFQHRELDIVWLRPHEFGTGVLFSNGDPRPEDCFDNFPYQNYNERSISKFLTVVCRALTVRSDYIRRSFVFYNDIVGCCCVRLWNGSSMDFVILDDRIPCLRSTNQPMFSNTFSGDVWICFLEKAIAKMHGSYEKAYPPGGERDLFRDLTGEIVLEYDIPNILRNHNEKELFQEIQSKTKSGACGIVTSILCPGGHEPQSFAVMEWGNGSHCGLSHDCCEFLVDIVPDCDINNNEALIKSNPSLVTRPFVDSPIVDSGLPWVAHASYCDLLSLSHRLSVCLFQSSPDAGQVNGISGEWSIEQGTAMGGRQLNTWRRNPIYRLRVHRKHGLHGLLRICLSQPDRRYMLPDDGNGQHEVYYEAMGLTALKDDPLLTRVLVDSGYKHQRDVVVEMMMGPEDDDTLLLVPSMYHFGVESTFHISICYVVDAEFASQPVSITLVTKWNQYSHKCCVQGEWTAESSPGRISNVSPETSRNPSWRLRIDANDQDIEDCKSVEMLVVIAAEQIVTMEADNDRMQVENMKIGTYLMTPYALSELIFNNGRCGSQDISDGYLNKITFSDQPENPTKYTFQLQRGILSDVRDYRDLVLMASTWKPGCLGRFEITVQCNFPISMEMIDIFHFDRVYKYYDRCAVANEMRQSKITTKSLQVGTLKQLVNSASMPLSIGNNNNNNNSQRMFADQSEASMSISGVINRNNTKDIVDKNVEHRWDVLDPKYSNRYNVKDVIYSTILHSQYLVETGQNVVQLDHFEMAKKTRKKMVRKYHYTGVRHYTPENYYWDKQDENDVSKIETRSQHVIHDTKLYDQVGTLRHSTADAIREQTSRKLEEFYKWRDKCLNGDDEKEEEQEEVNPYLDCY